MPMTNHSSNAMHFKFPRCRCGQSGQAYYDGSWRCTECVRLYREQERIVAHRIAIQLKHIHPALGGVEGLSNNTETYYS